MEGGRLAERCSTALLGRAPVESWSLGLGTVLPDTYHLQQTNPIFQSYKSFPHVTEFQKFSYLQHPALLVFCGSKFGLGALAGGQA